MTIAKGFSNFKHSSRWELARSIPAAAVPRISCADDVPPALLDALSPSSAATHRKVH
jgi:hypothetical protein